MTIVRTENYASIVDLLDDLENRSLSLRAFGVLLECAMRDENNFQSAEISEGVYLLLEQQFKTLSFLGEALRDQYHEMKLSKLRVSDIDTIVGATGISRRAVLSVLSLAIGVPEVHFEPKGELA